MVKINSRIKFFGIIVFVAIISVIFFVVFLPLTPKIKNEDTTFKTVEPSILLIALPKSGSTYLTRLFHKILKCDKVQLPPNLKENLLPSPIFNRYLKGPKSFNTLKFFFEMPSRIIAKEHYHPTYEFQNSIDAYDFIDIKELKKYTNKIVLHIRDPRQCFLSLMYHILSDPNSIREDSNVPANYNDLNLSDKIDWAIESMHYSVSWINMWLLVKKREDLSPDGLQILLTTYDELLEDEEALFNKIVTFYEIPFDRTTFKSLPKNAEVRFRKGDPNEWRTVLTEAQKKRVAEIMPDELLKRFNWKP